MAATIGLVLDCTNPNELAHFWSEALGYSTLGSAGSYVMLVDNEGIKPKLLLQAVPEAKSSKNRMHLGISTSRHPTSTARPPGWFHSARHGWRPAFAASTERTGSSWLTRKATNSVSAMAGSG